MQERRLAKNTTYFTAALTFQKILAFVYFWFISNSLMPGQLGQYVFALSFTTLFSIFVDLGLSPVLTREASKDGQKANDFLRSVIALKIPLGILTLLAAWIFINISGKPPEVRLLVYLASFVMLLDSFSLSFWVIFRARHNLKYESINTILVQIIIFTLGIIALKTTGQVKHLIVALLGASLFNFLFSASLLKLKLRFRLWPKWNSEIVSYFIKIIPAFALAGIFVKIYNTSDSVLLSYLADDEAVGFFAIPAKVVYAFQQVIPAAFAAVIFPAFSYYHCNSKELLGQTFIKAFRYLVIISLPLSLALVTLSAPIINLLWPEYQTIIPTFMIMSLAIPFIFLAFPTGYLLNACDRQKNTTLNRGLITALAVILNIILIPQYTFFGAGITFLVTNLILLFLDFIWVRKIIALSLNKLLLIVGKSLLATAIMIIFILILENYFSLLLLIPISALVYFTVLLLVKGFNFSELKLSKS
ncbi:MAG: hypothetical protein A2731_00115 [Candidatus Buchananbacteria bacterium RIFCSPHIGHO2_01_FULL_39_8]|uniref:Uncharacterized protein n=1 Tax=Candidatus Buchananbacteria bacterium RIFCSPHIGHO2_01_FULL_39_8 TaxID=1797533 RepID=A0A1G1XWE6_9BACT|nr:hypothetical protein [uncultured bacterium]OGY44358.1 MAG: hypothetical protein A2731_00115 [Candidatus Buchananbacteria bacterium RIFCSPHIGHO2_01_FULL_39_8]